MFAWRMASSFDATLVTYTAGAQITAYVEPPAVGDVLPDMPVFLDSQTYILAPLEATYQETWARCPRSSGRSFWRPLVNSNQMQS